jgi:hypothetical protein
MDDSPSKRALIMKQCSLGVVAAACAEDTPPLFKVSPASILANANSQGKEEAQFSRAVMQAVNCFIWSHSSVNSELPPVSPM